jgi:hypothetical protein
METVFFNNSNIVNRANNQLVYRFTNTTKFKNAKIALKSISMYYSWFNISEDYSNNQFQYTWFDNTGVLNQTITVHIPSGSYSIETLNEYFQSQMIANGHYVTRTVNSQVSNIYFFELVSNSTFYKFQINSYPMPTSVQNDATYQYTKPVGATWIYPAVATTPQIIIQTTNNFKTLLGFLPGSYPPVVQQTKYDVLGQEVPQIDPVSSLLLTCSLVNQRYSYPNTILYSFVNNASSFGSTLTSEPNALSWARIADGSYNEISLSIIDQSFNNISILDPMMVIALLIDQPPDEQESTTKTT